MDLKDFEKEIKEDANEVNPNNLEFETDKAPDAPPASPENLEQEEARADATPPPAPAALKLGDFGNIIVGAYCKLSDVVYSKVKKRAAPAWDDDTKKMLSDALAPVMQQYNIPVTPLTGLLGTVAMVEFMRYTNLNTQSNGETGTL